MIRFIKKRVPKGNRSESSSYSTLEPNYSDTDYFLIDTSTTGEGDEEGEEAEKEKEHEGESGEGEHEGEVEGEQQVEQEGAEVTEQEEVEEEGDQQVEQAEEDQEEEEEEEDPEGTSSSVAAGIVEGDSASNDDKNENRPKPKKKDSIKKKIMRSAFGGVNKRGLRRNKSKEINYVSPKTLAEKQRELDSSLLSKKVEELSNFDACVEACDALAASSAYAYPSGRKDPKTGLMDCSVLVSPDGDLLLIPTQNSSSDLSESTDATTATTTDTTTPTTKPKSDNKRTSTFLSEYATTFNTDDYKSAIFVGCDVHPEGDKAINGFSAKGWSIPATSLAMKQSEQSLVDMAHFVEEFLVVKKENCAKMRMTMDSTLRKTSIHRTMDDLTKKDRAHYQPDDWEVDDIIPPLNLGEDTLTASKHKQRREKALDLTRFRVGPTLHPASTIHTTTMALEQYYTKVLETDSNRWRSVSQHGGLLTKLRQASQDAAARGAYRRGALAEMYSRVKVMEGHLADCQKESKRRWENVYKAEEEVTKIMETKLLERSRKREQQRMQQFQQQQEMQQKQQKQIQQQQNFSTNNSSSNSESNNKNNNNNDDSVKERSPSEIWDIVSAVTEGMEEGSFEPMNLNQAKALMSNSSTSSGGVVAAALSRNTGGGGGSSAAPKIPGPVQIPGPLVLPEAEPIVSRADIEQDVNLPELRRMALAADEVVEDASGSLLNILSNMDMARRSARIASEASLLSSCNSQADCLRSLIALERKTLEENLKHLEDLESIAKEMNARRDLDTYIGWDRKENPGGTSHLGDDDDAGVASALAVLSSHVDGNMGLGNFSNTNSNRKDNSLMDGDSSSESEHDNHDNELKNITREDLEEAVDVVFDYDKKKADDADSTQAAFREAVDLLCRVAEDTAKSKNKNGGDDNVLSTRSRQSAICYALNTKRSLGCAEIKTSEQFDALCRIFASIFTGCNVFVEDLNHGGGVISNAKMCMMLAQTFYIEHNNDDNDNNNAENSNNDEEEDRNKRIFVKNKLTDHPLWSIEEFWDQTLFQCLSESLTHSGVMANFEMSTARMRQQQGNQNSSNHSDHSHNNSDRHRHSEWTETRKIKWHDLTYMERIEAASQVHAVVFAQLGALAHSMIEFGCGLERSCAFVRRMAVRNQLPISQRVALLQHLIDRFEKNNHEQQQQQQAEETEKQS